MEITLRLIKMDTATHRKRYETVQVNLPTYEVLLDGKVVGTIERTMVTREQGSRTARYVNRRWESPGWYGWAEGARRSYFVDRTTRADAILDALPFDWYEAIKYRDAAKAAKVVKN